MVTPLKLLQELIIHIAGKGTEVIAELLLDKKDVNEFKLAKKLNLTINQTRNILYKLHAQNVLSFTRKKDKTRGWYVYYYTLNTKKSLEKLISLKKKEIEALEGQQKSRETKSFFSCPGGCLEVNEETALLHNFLCPECEQLLQLTPPEKLISEIKSKIERVQKEIDVAQDEFNKIIIKEEKQKERKAKKAKKKVKKKGKKKSRKKIKKKKAGKKKVNKKKTRKRNKRMRRILKIVRKKSRKAGKKKAKKRKK